MARRVSREAAQQPAAAREAPGAARRVSRDTAQQPAAAREAPMAELITAMTQPAAVAPQQPQVRAPSMPLAPLPEALPATINEMAEMQRLARDPMRLAEHVQGLESNAAELEQLKAFAAKFVELPPDRVDQRIMNPGGRAGSQRGSRSPAR